MLPVFYLVLCIKSEQENKPKAFEAPLRVSSPSPAELADSRHVPRGPFVSDSKGSKWHFQRKHAIMCADLSVRLLLAQPVS